MPGRDDGEWAGANFLGTGPVGEDLQPENSPYTAAREFLERVGIATPTPDAVEQLVDAFLPCLQIMCDRPWSPDGATWRKSGVLGSLTDVRKKFERLWERGWVRGKRHDDSGFDLINYIGFYMRSEEEPPWGQWGDPSA